MTCHYIDEKWKLHKKILKFSYIESPHGGEQIASVLMKKLLHWNLDSKVFSIVVDNAKSNDKVVKILKINFFGKKNLLMDGSNEEWHYVRSLLPCLKNFHEATEKFSGSKYPTSNLYFSIMCKIYIHIRKWFESSSLFLASMAFKMLENFEKYWKLNNVILAFASILDPQYKMQVV